MRIIRIVYSKITPPVNSVFKLKTLYKSVKKEKKFMHTTKAALVLNTNKKQPTVRRYAFVSRAPLNRRAERASALYAAKHEKASALRQINIRRPTL